MNTPTSTPSGQRSPAAIPEGPVVIGALRAADDKRAEAARVIASMKPAFVSCRQRALARQPAGPASLQGRLRLLITVAASGKIRAVDLPQWNPTNPVCDPDAAGSPVPNPNNAKLDHLVVPCLMARIQQARFGAAETSWTFTVDFRIQ
jgi:hypothetical protein